MGQEGEATNAANAPGGAAAPRMSDMSDSAEAPPLRVALVGTDGELDGFLRGVLSDEACEARAVADEAALLALAGDGHLDLVVADADVLGSRPEALTRAVKAVAPQTIVMLVATDASARPLVQALRAGAYDLFLKPVPLDELRERLRQAIRNKRLGQSLARRSREMEEAARQHEREIFEVKQYLENLVETAGDAIMTTDLAGRITSWNKAAQATLGHAKEAALVTDLLALASGGGPRGQLAALLGEARRGQTTHNAETVWRRKDRKDVTVSLSVSPIMDRGQRTVGILLIARDVTERKRLQEELFHAEKLASIGQLAAGVAHQVNNPLGAISGRAQMLARLKSPLNEDFLREQIGKIQADCGRIAETVTDLLGFARKSDTEKQYTNVNTILDETVEMVDHEAVARKVTVVRRYAADLPLVVASANHLRQLFANLMTNAFDAMAGGGSLTITSVFRPAGPETSDPVVEVAFADTGVGIPEEDLTHIFEPFFTTKPPGEGTGLGLAVAKRIVDFHNGHLDVRSQVGVGTTFLVQLPAE
jgi:PAS domain S-box-containing protein